MKIKVKKLSYSEVCKLRKPKHRYPRRSAFIMRVLMKALGKTDLKATNFSYKLIGMDKLPKEPCLIFMNHSSFIDLEIVSSIFFPKSVSIVCTSDGFVGKPGLMRALGCIPTQKFVSDSSLITDIGYALKRKKSNVLMYPEASYSFDGKATALPRKLGVVLKLLKVPVIMITTHGAFARDPLYNMLQKRNVNVSADVELLLTKEQIKEKSINELGDILDNAFSFDNFAWQKENNIQITEDFRADGLERILFRCHYCDTEGEMLGKGTKIRCNHCGVEHELTPLGELHALNRDDTFYPHIPDWYEWERGQIRTQLTEGTYTLECDCRILCFRDYKAIYDIGEGHLSHNSDGFVLKNADATLYYTQSPLASYSLYADYYWYEIGDIICIGTNDMLYYCIPKADDSIPVAKARLAAEELYKLKKYKTRISEK